MLPALVQRFIAADGLFNAVRKVTRKLPMQQEHVAEHIPLKLFQLFARKLKAFGYGNNRITFATQIAAAYQIINLIERHRKLRNQHKVCICRNARLQCDPARVPPHTLHNKTALVGFCRGVQAIDLLHRNVGGRIESKRPIRAGQVVVDRFRHADHVHAKLAQRVRHTERIVSADSHEPLKVEPLHRLPHNLGPIFKFHNIGA